MVFHPAESSGPRVAVVGGSIGGLSCCHALLRAGCRVACFEKAKGVSEAGAGLGLDPEACEALCSWGLAQQLEQANLPLHIEENRTVDRRTATCRILTRDDHYDHRSVHWADIHRMLLESLPPGVVHMGCTVTGFEDLTGEVGGVRVKLNGGDTPASVDADLMVAADGSMSHTRKKLAPHKERRYSGYCAWRGVLQGDQHEDLVGRLRGMYKELGKALYFDIAEVEHAVVYELPRQRINWLWYVNQPMPSLHGDSVTIKADEEKVAHMKSAAEEKWLPELAALMKATEEPFINAIFDREPLDVLVYGRVVLVGEAAHPTTPHGLRSTNMSIIDAACLEKCLKKHLPRGTKGLEEALADFNRERLPVTTREVLFSRFLGQLKQSLLLPRGVRSWLEADPKTAEQFLPQKLRKSFDPEEMYAQVEAVRVDTAKAG